MINDALKISRSNVNARKCTRLHRNDLMVRRIMNFHSIPQPQQITAESPNSFPLQDIRSEWNKDSGTGSALRGFLLFVPRREADDEGVFSFCVIYIKYRFGLQENQLVMAKAATANEVHHKEKLLFSRYTRFRGSIPPFLRPQHLFTFFLLSIILPFSSSFSFVNSHLKNVSQ